MDPDEALKEIMRLYRGIAFRSIPEHGGLPEPTGIEEQNDEDRRAIVEGFVELDNWLRRGGYLPLAWRTVGHPQSAPEIRELRDAFAAAIAAQDGDSNDTEIEALRDLAQLALRRWPEVDDVEFR